MTPARAATPPRATRTRHSPLCAQNRRLAPATASASRLARAPGGARGPGAAGAARPDWTAVALAY
eukprot:7380196-Prymnesium_polylepis.1